jgi:uncharacterized protein
MRPSQILAQHRADILAVAGKYRMANLRVFGSVVRGKDKDGSDVDFLVDAPPGTTLFDLGGFQDELETMMGVKVDVVTSGGLPNAFKDRVLGEARPV